MRERFILQGLVMLIAFTLSLATPFKAHAQSGQKERITIMVKQKPLEEVLKKLSKEYNYQLFYNNSLVKGIRVSVSIQKAGINQTMDVLLAGTGLQYSIKEKQSSLPQSLPGIPQKKRNCSAGMWWIKKGELFRE